MKMEDRPQVTKSGEPSEECPECRKKAYRHVVFRDGTTGWFCYACEHRVPEK